MIFHYFKIAFRNILKYKTQSVISMIGLAVGFTCLPSQPVDTLRNDV